VDQFCADIQDKGNPFAIVEMHVAITRQNDRTEKKSFTAKTPLSIKPTAGHVVEGLSACLAEIFGQLASWLQTETNLGS